MKVKILYGYITLIILLTTLPLHLFFDFGDDQWSNNFLSLIPADKVGHFALYFGLGVILAWNKLTSKKYFIISFLFALMMELLHLGIPYRTFELMDLFSNELGLIISFWVSHLRTQVQSHQ